MISFDEFQRMDLRVGTVQEVSEHPNADKLMLLSADIGKPEPVQLVAGVKGHYENNQLEGKQIIVLTNMEPATIRGEQSEGMLLAATTEDDVALLVPDPDKDVPAGSQVE